MNTIKNDSISDTIISGTSEADSVANYASRVTINAGAGNDTIYNSSAAPTVVANAGNGNDVVYNYASRVTINAGDGNDFVQNSSDASRAIVDGGKGNDLIHNYGSNVTVGGGDGNDYIFNRGSRVSINGGDGDDSITNRGANVMVLGGDGNDRITNSGENAALDAGGGINTVIASYDVPELIQISDGALLVENFNYDDTIWIANGSLESFNTDGGNLILNVSNGNSVTLKNMTNHAITIADSSGSSSTAIYGNGYSPLDVIRNFMRSIRYSASTDRTAKLNEAIRACSDFNSLQDVVDQMISDRENAADAKTFLEDYCGIILGNDDTGAITGWDAGGLVAKDIDSIMVETLPADTLSSLTDATYSKGGLNVTYTQDESTLSSEQQRILQGAYSWWIEESSALIEETFGLAFDDNNVTLNVVDNQSSNYWGITNKRSGGNVVTINLKYTSFDDEDEDDLDANSVDRCLAHELTHVAQNVYLSTFPQFMKEGMAELAGGIDDMRVNSISQLASNVDSLSAYLDLSKYGTGNRYYYAAGYMFWRYLAKQASDAYADSKTYAFSENALLEGTAGDDLLTAWGAGLTVDGGAGNDTINARGTDNPHVYVFGSDSGQDVVLGYSSGDAILISNDEEYSTTSSGDDLIINVGSSRMTLKDAADETLNVVNLIVNGDDSIKVSGTSEDDLIVNDGARVTIDAGEGDDTIVGSDYGERFLFNYLSGDDVITNFGVNDTLKSTKGTIKSIATVGADVVVTLKRSKTTATVTLVDAASYTFKKSGSYVTVIDTISNDADGVTLNGTSKAEVIINSGSNVTIDAGKGNDTITGSDGGDRFLFNYASGNDVITNFGVDDTLQNTAGTMSYKKSGDDYVVKIKRGSTSATITLLDVATDYKLKKKGKTITLKAKSGSSAQEAANADYWFIDEPTNESPLSEIVEQESAIDLSTDFMVETLERKTEALIGASRHRSKK